MNKEIKPGYYRISIKILVLNEDESRFLLVRSDDGRWDLPGGGLKWGESTVECIKREIMEEMGIDVINIQQKPKYFFPVVSDIVKYAYVVYQAELSNLDFISSDECREISFVSAVEAKEINIKPNVEVFLDMYK